MLKVLDFADLGALRGAIDAEVVDIDDVSRNGEEWSTHFYCRVSKPLSLP